MGKFAEFCNGKTMGAFFLLLLPPGTAFLGVAENQAGAPTARNPTPFKVVESHLPVLPIDKSASYRGRAPLPQKMKVVNPPVGFRTFHSGTRLMRVRKRDWVVNAPPG